MKKLMYLLIVVLLFGGCASTVKYEAKLNNYIGQDENSLIAAWGVPHKTYKLDNGKKALEYARKETIQNGGYTYSVPQTTYQSGTIGGQPYSGTSTTYATGITPVQKYKLYCKTSFILDNDGKVESWHHEGNDCTAN